MQAQGHADPDDDLVWPWDGMQTYSDAKLYDVLVAFAVARLWPGVLSNAVDPGWVKTKLGGPNATDELEDGAETQVWLATGTDAAAQVTGRYLKRRKVLDPNPQATDVRIQEAALERLATITGVELPR